MHYFQYQQDELYCEEVPIRDIAEEVGTPFYLYSHRTLKRHFNAFDGAFGKVDHLTCFSVKANSNLAILKIFADLGSGMDVVSGGELYRSLLAGTKPEKIVYSGVGKTLKEIEYALKTDILMFNVESLQELTAINHCAGRFNMKARVSLRINPDIDPKTHPYISTGMKSNKFGIDIKHSFEDYLHAKEMEFIEVVGVDCHIGSQLTEVEPFIDALEKLAGLINQLRGQGFAIKYLDLGGGLGIKYDQESPPHPSEYADAIIKCTSGLESTLIFEPGRVLVGNAGILIAEVLYTKSTELKNFIIVDAGMNDLLRPSLYDSFHEILPINRKNKEEMQADIVGPICESGDFLARERVVPKLEQGDLIAAMSAGAYGFTMSSNYNSRTRPAEILVDGKNYHIIRERETWLDLVRGESIPEFLK